MHVPRRSVSELTLPTDVRRTVKTNRPLRAEVYREYGLENHQLGACEIDHLIAIALGGSNDIKNLWPQSLDDAKPWNAKLKDRLERRLHQLVCIDHTLSLHDALASDWIAAYRKYVGER
jgi:hypothetical protein